MHWLDPKGGVGKRNTYWPWVRTLWERIQRGGVRGGTSLDVSFQRITYCKHGSHPGMTHRLCQNVSPLRIIIGVKLYATVKQCRNNSEWGLFSGKYKFISPVQGSLESSTGQERDAWRHFHYFRDAGREVLGQNLLKDGLRFTIIHLGVTFWSLPMAKVMSSAQVFLSMPIGKDEAIKECCIQRGKYMIHAQSSQSPMF